MKSTLYDPIWERSDLESPFGFDLFEKDDSSQFAKNRNLCTGARSKLIGAVRGLLVGMDARALKQIEAARAWYERSIESGEEGTFAGGRAGVLEGYALTRWLLTAQPEIELFREALERQLATMSEGDSEADSFNLDMAAALCIHARAYDQALELKASAHHVGDSPNTPRSMAFELAARSRANGIEKSSLADLTSKFLKKHMNEWIGRGHHLTAVSWLKIIHWDLEGCTRTPVDVLRFAHNYLKKK